MRMRALLPAALPILLAACSKPETTITPAVTAVRVQAATLGPATPPIATSGIVATKDEMRLSFKVGGMIKAIYVEEGDTVRAGQKLAEIELTEIDSQLEEARQLAEKAKRDLERGERLYADNHVISLVQLEDLRTEAALRQAQLKSTQFNRGYAVITARSDGKVLRKLAARRAGQRGCWRDPRTGRGARSTGDRIVRALHGRRAPVRGTLARRVAAREGVGAVARHRRRARACLRRGQRARALESGGLTAWKGSSGRARW